MKKEVTIFIIAIASGLIATVLVFNFLRSAGRIQSRYVVTKADLLPGDILTSEDLTLSKPLNVTNGKSLFVAVQDVTGQKVIRNISKGGFVYRSNVTRDIASGEVQKKTLPIPKGIRALTLSQNDISQMPNLLDVGSYVDVIGYTLAVSGEKEMRTILGARQVISKEVPEGGTSESVTLAVDPAEAEMVIQSASRGKLQLVVLEGTGEPWSLNVQSGSVEIIRGVKREGMFKQ